MKILSDYHHSDLYESFQLLADRFGWEWYRPIGMEWFDQWYWSFERAFHGDSVAKQYLSIWDSDRDCGDHWERDDTTHPGRVHKMLTVEQARDNRPDIVIATVTHNERGLAKFASQVGARFGIQVGNVGQIGQVELEGAGWGLIDFCLLSTTTPYTPPKPHVIYRQEFDLTDFRYEYPPAETNSVSSFVQCFPENRGPGRGSFYDQFLSLADELVEEFDFRVYGAYGSEPEDHLACGNLNTTPDVAKAMRASRIAWHAKFWSDGYGHVIHNLHAVGRPILSYHDYYADKLAAPLMEHGVTGFDLSQMSRGEIIATLRRLRDDHEYHEQISRQTADRFREVVDFDADAEAVRTLIEA
jgi:hypothetical protein